MTRTKAFGITSAVVAIASIGACIGWHVHYMRPRPIASIPAASALVITNRNGTPTNIRITDRAAVDAIVRKMNEQVDDGWHPVVGERPLPKLSVAVETRSGAGAYWDIGDGWFGAADLYKDVSKPQCNELQTDLTTAPHATEQGSPSKIP